MTRNHLFRNRAEAGRLLARQLGQYAHRPDVVVLALPRGGVPVGFEVAHALRVPFDILIVRKLGVPRHEELAMGAIGSGGVLFRNEPVIAAYQVTREELEAALHRESAEVMRREQLYRGDRPPLRYEGKIVIIVDDGIATGATMLVAVRAMANARSAARVVAAPVIAADTARELQEQVDEVIAVATPDDLVAIGQYYADFRQTTDDEVQKLLGRCTTDGGCPKGKESEEPACGQGGKRTKRPGQIPSRWEWNFRTLIGLRNHLLRGRGDRLREPGDAMEPPSQHGTDLIDELYDRDLALALPAKTATALQEVDAAIRRIENGTYGICEATGRRITQAHLQAVPWRRFAPEAPARPQAKVKRAKIAATNEKIVSVRSRKSA